MNVNTEIISQIKCKTIKKGKKKTFSTTKVIKKVKE